MAQCLVRVEVLFFEVEAVFAIEIANGPDGLGHDVEARIVASLDSDDTNREILALCSPTLPAKAPVGVGLPAHGLAV